MSPFPKRYTLIVSILIFVLLAMGDYWYAR